MPLCSSPLVTPRLSMSILYLCLSAKVLATWSELLRPTTDNAASFDVLFAGDVIAEVTLPVAAKDAGITCKSSLAQPCDDTIIDTSKVKPDFPYIFDTVDSVSAIVNDKSIDYVSDCIDTSKQYFPLVRKPVADTSLGGPEFNTAVRIAVNSIVAASPLLITCGTWEGKALGVGQLVTKATRKNIPQKSGEVFVRTASGLSLCGSRSAVQSTRKRCKSLTEMICILVR